MTEKRPTFEAVIADLRSKGYSQEEIVKMIGGTRDSVIRIKDRNYRLASGPW